MPMSPHAVHNGSLWYMPEKWEQLSSCPVILHQQIVFPNYTLAISGKIWLKHRGCTQLLPLYKYSSELAAVPYLRREKSNIDIQLKIKFPCVYDGERGKQWHLCL